MRFQCRSTLALLAAAVGPLSTAAAQARIRSGPSLAAALAVAAPGNVAVTGDAKSVTITWTAAPGAISYRVLRAPDLTTPATDLTPPIAATSYTDATVASGQTYYYTVVATAANGLTGSAPAVTFAVPAQLVKIGAIRPTRSLVLPAAPSTLPAIVSIAPSQPYPGQTVTLTGSNLSGITGITVTRAGQTGAPDAVADLQKVSSPSGTQATFEMPFHASWLHGQQLAIVVSNGSGAGTAFSTTVDRTAAITGATVPVALSGSGSPITVQGKNLDRVQAGYIDVTSTMFPPSPKFPTVPGPLGLSVTMMVPAGCSRRGNLRFEEAGDGSGATTAHMIAGQGGGCGFPPVITSMVPQVATPGATVHVYGQGLSWVTIRDPNVGNVGSTVVSDNEITFRTPTSFSGASGTARTITPSYGAQAYSPRLAGPFVSKSATLSLVIAFPPKVNALLAPYGESGQPVTISGLGLADPALQPTVTVGPQQATIISATATAITFTMPALDPNDYPNASVPVTVQHAGGSSTAPTQLIIVDGPSTITSISPATVPAGQSTVVTVQGTNLARARGICLPGATQTILGRIDPVTNTYQLMVTVLSSARSGPVSVAVPQSPTQPQQLVCQPNPTAVNITVQ